MILDGWRITRHAQERAEEMGIPLEAVVEVARSPSLAYENNPRKYPGRWLHCRDALSVCVNPADRVVITVLWNSEHPWERQGSTPPTSVRGTL